MQAKINQTKQLKCIFVIIKLHNDDFFRKAQIFIRCFLYKKPQLRGFSNSLNRTYWFSESLGSLGFSVGCSGSGEGGAGGI